MFAMAARARSVLTVFPKYLRTVADALSMPKYMTLNPARFIILNIS